MRRKTTEQLRQSGASRAAIERRKVETAALDVLGEPLRPQGKARQWRETWNKVAAELLAARRLSRADGGLLAALVDALRASRAGTDAEREASRVEARLIVSFYKYFTEFSLLPWQVLVTLDLFCWKKATGYRLRSKLFLSVGRKNGKTYWAGATALFCLLCDQEKYPELYSFAMTKDKSRICWKDTKHLLKICPLR